MKIAKAIRPLQRATLPRLLSECGGDGAGDCVGGGLRGEELNGVEEEVAEDGEECERQPTLPTPTLPSASDVDKHRCTHRPYRSWCRHCVEGRGREQGHVATDQSARKIAIVGFDYMFVGKRRTYEREEELEEDDKADGVLKVLVVRCFKSKALFAHAVPAKGVDEAGYVVDCVVQDILWLGYSKVILKCDNEPAILKLLAETLKVLKVEGLDQACEEHPVPYDSKSNGGIEVGCRLVRGMTTTLRSFLEDRIGHRIPPAHPSMSWLVSHAATIITYNVCGEDGMSAYHRIRGRPFGGNWISFGEKVRFRMGRDASDDKRMELAQGIFVGFQRNGAQYVIYDFNAQKVVNSRTVTRLPDAMKWDSEALQKVKCTPWQLHVPTEPEIIFKDKIAQDADAEAPVRLARKMYVRQADF